MWVALSWFLRALGLIVLLAIIFVVLAIYCYGRLAFTLKSVSASPEFKMRPAAVIGSLFSVVTGNFISAAGAAGGLVNGVRIDGQIACLNPSFVPLYLPEIEHDVSIGGKLCQHPFHTHALWLKPGASETMPINMTLGTGDIPQVALMGLTHSGVIDIEIQSKVVFGSFSYLKVTRITTKIPDYLPKIAKSNKKPPL
jgi:hypothetical protein